MKLYHVGLGGLMFAAAVMASPGTRQQATFQIKDTIQMQVPAGRHDLRMWFAVPQQDAASKVSGFNVSSAFPVSYNRDDWGNRVGYADVTAPPGSLTLAETFTLTRSEVRHDIDPARTRPLTAAERNALSAYLQPSTNVVVDSEIKHLAHKIVGSETNPAIAMRKLYQWTVDNFDYWVKDPKHMKASPMGSSVYCLSCRTGNCTDVHSLLSSLAMASGIPSRMVYGSLLKPSLNGQPVDASYHCWVEFYAPNYGWLPVDAALANIYARPFTVNADNRKLVELTTATGYHGPDPSLVNYYFGNLDDRRIVWSMGRDLMMQPPQDAGPINALTRIYVEADGHECTTWTRQLTYQEGNS